MSVNLVDLVMQQVGGNAPGILGSLLGESAERTKGALAGAVPAVLGGLIGAASKGGGIVEQIAGAVGQQDDSLLDNLIGALGGGHHKQVAEQGSSILSSLLGDGVIGALVGAIGKYSGLGSGSTKSLLGMLVPIVMSVLSREQKAQGLDGGGLIDMLMAQRENIQQALPAGMASALGGGSLLDVLMGGAQSATESIGEAVEMAAGTAGTVAAAVSSAAETVGAAAESVGEKMEQAAATVESGARQAASTVQREASVARPSAAGTERSGGSWLRWLLPLIILLGLLWLAFNFLGGAGVAATAADAVDVGPPFLASGAQGGVS